jgi:hypothetical protein
MDGQEMFERKLCGAKGKKSRKAPGSNVMLIKSADQPARLYKVFLDFAAIFRIRKGGERN